MWCNNGFWQVDAEGFFPKYYCVYPGNNLPQIVSLSRALTTYLLGPFYLHRIELMVIEADSTVQKEESLIKFKISLVRPSVHQGRDIYYTRPQWQRATLFLRKTSVIDINTEKFDYNDYCLKEQFLQHVCSHTRLILV